MGFREPSEFLILTGLFAILCAIAVSIARHFSLHPLWGLAATVFLFAAWFVTLHVMDWLDRRK